MSQLYILDKLGRPTPVADIYEWGAWMEKAERRRVALDEIGDAQVSTVFLGLDYQYGSGPPILWETMVFGGKLDQEQFRCSGSREQAEAMHARAVAKVRQSME